MKGSKFFDTQFNRYVRNLQNTTYSGDDTDLLNTNEKVNLGSLLISPKNFSKIEQMDDAYNHQYQMHLDTKLSVIDSQNRMMNSQRLMQDKFQKDMKECTFQPNPHKKIDRVNIDKILFSQDSFQIQKELNLEKAKDKVLKKINSQIKDPELCVKSLEILQQNNYCDVPVHERLFALSKQNWESNKQSQEETYFFPSDKDEEKRKQFHPQISKQSQNLVRPAKVEQLLYNDAIRRCNLQWEIEQELSQQNVQTESQVLNHSHKLVALGFIKEFERITQQRKSPAIDYLFLGQVLMELGFLDQKIEDRIWIQKIWNMLGGGKYHVIQKRNLCLFCLAVLNLSWKIPNLQLSNQLHLQPEKQLEYFDYDMWRQTARNGLDYLQQIQNKENVVNLATFDNDAFQGSIGQFDSNNLWYISESDGVSIHQNFEYLYRNRLHNRRQKIRQVDLVDQEEPSFKPNVLKQSRKLAEKYRERVLEETALLIENQLLDVKVPENGLITHADLLMMQSRSQEIFRQRKKNELEEIQVRECSFRPQILDYKSQKQDVYNQEVAYRPQQYKPSQRYLQLYQLAKPSKQRQDKTNLQIDYEKHCDECTFTPDISQSQKQNLSKKLIYAKNVDSTIERMRKANEQRKIDDYWKHGRGYQVPKKNQNKHKSFVRQEQKNIFQQINDSNESEVEYKPHNQIHQRQSTEQDERIPLLFVDVNLGNGVQERIVVYEGDQSQNLAQQFVIQHNLDPSMISRLKENLDIQISSLLHRIDEENQQELTEENSQLY